MKAMENKKCAVREMGAHRACRPDQELKSGRGPLKLLWERSNFVKFIMVDALKMDMLTLPLNWFLLTFLEQNNRSWETSEVGGKFE